jgi:hypothetical protein
VQTATTERQPNLSEHRCHRELRPDDDMRLWNLSRPTLLR